MIAKIVQIGNSKGIRIPKPLIEQIGAPEEVELIIKNKELIIRPLSSPRKGWEDSFRLMAENNDDRLFDSEDQLIANEWDNIEWTW